MSSDTPQTHQPTVQRSLAVSIGQGSRPSSSWRRPTGGAKQLSRDGSTIRGHWDAANLRNLGVMVKRHEGPLGPGVSDEDGPEDLETYIPLLTLLGSQIPLLQHKACFCSTLSCLPLIFHFWQTTYAACAHRKIKEPQLRLLSHPAAWNSLPKNLHDSSISLLSFKSMLQRHICFVPSPTFAEKLACAFCGAIQVFRYYYY